MLGEFINEGKREGVRGQGSSGHAVRTGMQWVPRTLECGDLGWLQCPRKGSAIHRPYVIFPPCSNAMVPLLASGFQSHFLGLLSSHVAAYGQNSPGMLLIESPECPV